MITAVIPVHNEKESLLLFYKELESCLKQHDEIIFIDDGSTDSSLELLKELEKKDRRIRVFSFRKKRGKAEALTVGFQKAKREKIVTLDADLQDKPDQISILEKKLDSGFDLVSGWRRERKDSFLNILFSKLFNFLAGSFWGLRLHDYNCGLKIYRAECAKSLRLYGGLHRFIPLLAYDQGFKVAEIPVIHQKRLFGKSKYGISKVWKDLPDMFTMLFLTRYGKRPMHFFGIIGIFSTFLGILIIAYLYIFIHAQGEAITKRPLFFFGIVFILSGLQILFTGFLADLIINKSYESSESVLRYSTEQ